ncbi:hypothetical protein BC828DRAFT_419335 [Blastocladiella britannica]|nr:hypothetical protein BC828DRAFT_419335 [Blastocladiella britannica]
MRPFTGENETIIRSIAGGGYESSQMRAMWIAVYTALVAWMAALLVLYLVAGGPSTGSPGRVQPEGPAYVSAPIGEIPAGTIAYTGPGDVPSEKDEAPWAGRMRRAVRAARLVFLLLLSSTVITALGYGASGGSVALVWVSFGIGMVWVVTELVADSHWLRLLYSAMLFPLVAVVFGLAYRSRV